MYEIEMSNKASVLYFRGGVKWQDLNDEEGLYM